jgi:hypothetical protein
VEDALAAKTEAHRINTLNLKLYKTNTLDKKS